MLIHGNARLLPSQRALLCTRVRQEGWTAAEAAEAFGVSIRTAFRWLSRFDAGEPMTAGPGADGGPPSFISKIDLRLHPDDAGFVRGMPSGMMRVSGWFRLRDEPVVDTLGLLVAVDAFPPTIFNASLPVGWTPTVELTAHIRARPAPGWLRCVFTTRFVTGGFIEEDGEVWDDTGTLVAQSRQLALVPRPVTTGS